MGSESPSAAANTARASRVKTAVASAESRSTVIIFAAEVGPLPRLTERISGLMPQSFSQVNTTVPIAMAKTIESMPQRPKP